VGNYWIKEVNPEASSFARWWARGTLRAQARALDKLGDMAPPHLFRNGRLVTRDVGRFCGSRSQFWRIWAKGSWRLGTPLNDIRPRNIGAGGQIFDPALHPLQQALYWGGGCIIVYKSGELIVLLRAQEE